MSSPADPPLPPAHRALLQRIINLYHLRLIASWSSATGWAEAVPATHISPPSIAAWPHSQVQQALTNFKEHTAWFKHVRWVPGRGVRRDVVAEAEEMWLVETALGLPQTARGEVAALEGCVAALERRYGGGYAPVLVPNWGRFEKADVEAEENLVLLGEMAGFDCMA
ncbi:hypothetical protein EDC01DRAFT_779116 [Geopyxis carbonaria]|nr:hypothetical protein EDC01DRAFT_779116 [Geopyxis carbonaria]